MRALGVCLSIAFANALSAPSESCKLRQMLPRDVDQVASLCVEAFVPLDWWQVVEKSGAVGDYRRKLGGRMMSPEPGHAMVVAEQQERVVGFVEIGLLPAPPGSRWREDVSSDATVPEVPYLGNLVVAPALRRRGVAKSLVRFAEAWAQRRLTQDALCAVVECDNADAQKFYGSLGYAALPENRGRLYYTKDLA